MAVHTADPVRISSSLSISASIQGPELARGCETPAELDLLENDLGGLCKEVGDFT